MITMVIIILIALFFLGLIVYSSVAPNIIRKKGRKVDARVVSCEVANISVPGTGINTYCYNVKVDFYGLSGETIVKEIQSEKSYEVGDVVRSIYIDKKDRFFSNEDKPIVKFSSGKKVTTIVIIAMLIIVIAVVIMNYSDNEDLKSVMSLVLGYDVAILFAGYGIYQIITILRKNRDQSNIQVIMGTQVSYDKQLSSGSRRRFIYYPIYEYQMGGERLLYRGHIGGNTKKYQQIGRQVHMEHDLVTGEIRCREDEKTSLKLSVLMTAIGLFFLCLMIVQNMKDIQANQSAEAALKGKAYNFFITYGDETMEKCAFTIDINEDGSGVVTLFPMVAVEGKSINQTISFQLSDSEKKDLFSYLEKIPLSSLMNTKTEEKEGQIIYIYRGKDNIGGLVPDDASYGDACEKVMDYIPDDIMKEMNDREETYYQ